MNSLGRYKLKVGDTIAVIAPSSGKAAQFPQVYKTGIKNLEEIFGLKIKEFDTAKMSDERLYQSPEKRAEDLNDAFADPKIKGIITTIGGDDSVRILPFLDKKIIKENPKVFMGYSDATILLTFINQLGLISFHGPSVMAGIAQTKNLPIAFEKNIKSILFEDFNEYEYQPYDVYCDGYQDWNSPHTTGETAALRQNPGWNWLNGKKNVTGELFGGCIEAFEFLKATQYWPESHFWHNKILFLETSEDKPTVDQVKYMLRNYGTQGVFQKISALLFGRPNFYSKKEKSDLDKMIHMVVTQEFKAAELPIITNMDFGHTDPQFILPLGASVKIDFKDKKIILQA